MLVFWLYIRSLLAIYQVSFGYILGLFWLYIRSLLAIYQVSFGLTGQRRRGACNARLSSGQAHALKPFPRAVWSHACAEQTSVKRDPLQGQKRPTICGLLRASDRGRTELSQGLVELGFSQGLVRVQSICITGESGERGRTELGQIQQLGGVVVTAKSLYAQKGWRGFIYEPLCDTLVT